MNKPSKAEHDGQSVGCLLVLAGESTGRIHQLVRPRSLIGSDPGAHLHLSDDGIQPLHLELLLEGDSVILNALDRNADTYVNGDPAQRRSLVDGDRIQLGSRALLKYRTRLPKDATRPTHPSNGPSDRLVPMTSGINPIPSSKP